MEMYLMFCILHLFIFHGANRIDGGAPRGDLLPFGQFTF